MLPELGHFAIILALGFALIQSNARNIAFGVTAAIGQFSFLLFSLFCLIISFINNDMTVLYVQEHSHALLPFIYRVGAAWGGHEGSLLLWCCILSFWTVAFIIFSNTQLSRRSFAWIVRILGWISSGFIAFLFFTSNPFERIFPTVPYSGEDLTPVLQDPGLIFHPPMLYLGYVGFAIAFAFSICALIEGKLDKHWVQACRPWVILPWSFLSIGIVLGSWWAYRELGWGGWWFWDPVENASLLPWLSATALIHTLVVSEKRNVFKGWTILLAIITFALSLLGTFLVRSGILVSVHTFANDPGRGLFLLTYLAILIGGALLLYSFRIKLFYKAPQFNLLSRETFLLINSIIFLTAVITIVIGTLYPILLDALNKGKISVGEPYFNTVFLPIMLPLLLLMGLAPYLNWGSNTFMVLWKKISCTLFVSLLMACFIPIILGIQFHVLAAIGMAAALWIILATAQFFYTTFKKNKKLTLKYSAMCIAHVGIAIMVLGITVNKTYSEERQVKISKNETVNLADYQVTLTDITKKDSSNYQSIETTFLVHKKNKLIGQLLAEQRVYRSHDQTLNKPAILTNVWRDLYLALGTSFPDGSWSIRIYYKPFVRWIWAGGFLLLIGGIMTLFKKREDQYETV